MREIKMARAKAQRGESVVEARYDRVIAILEGQTLGMALSAVEEHLPEWLESGILTAEKQAGPERIPGLVVKSPGMTADDFLIIFRVPDFAALQKMQTNAVVDELQKLTELIDAETSSVDNAA